MLDKICDYLIGVFFFLVISRYRAVVGQVLISCCRAVVGQALMTVKFSVFGFDFM